MNEARTKIMTQADSLCIMGAGSSPRVCVEQSQHGITAAADYSCLELNSTSAAALRTTFLG